MIIQTIPVIRKANLGPGIRTNVNKICSNTEEEGYSEVEEEDRIKIGESEIKTKESKTQAETMADLSLRWNRDRKSSLCGEKDQNLLLKGTKN